MVMRKDAICGKGRQIESSCNASMTTGLKDIVVTGVCHAVLYCKNS